MSGPTDQVFLICPPLFALMAIEALIVQVVQFVPTKEYLADPSLFQTVREVVEHWR